MAGHNPGHNSGRYPNYGDQQYSEGSYATQSYAEYQESLKKNQVFASDKHGANTSKKKNSRRSAFVAIGAIVVVIAGVVGLRIMEESPIKESVNDDIADFMDDNADGMEGLNASHDEGAALVYAQEQIDARHFSESELLEDLTSEYGEVYTMDAAEYALDNVDADWNGEALEAAESYLEHGHFSYDGLHHQLTADTADNYTDEQARYAVDTVDADWNAEAVEAAESYWNLDTIDIDAEGLRDLLSADDVGRFTDEQVDHAMEELGIS